MGEDESDRGELVVTHLSEFHCPEVSVEEAELEMDLTSWEKKHLVFLFHRSVYNYVYLLFKKKVDALFPT